MKRGEAKGVWSSKPRGIDDLIKRAREMKLTSLFIMKQRTFDAKACAQLCEVLRENESLTELYASNHEIGEVGLKAFASMLRVNKTLKKICIGTSERSDMFMKILCSGLRENVGLTVLDATNRKLTAESAKVLGNVFVENKASKLEELYLSRNNFGARGVEILFRTLVDSSAPSKLLTLDLSSNEIDDATLRCGIELGRYLALKSCILKSLILSHNPFVSTSFCSKGLDMNRSLCVLEMKACGVRDEDLLTLFHALSDQNTLIELDLSDNRITSSGTDKLAHYLRGAEKRMICSKLKSLCLSGNSIADATTLATSLDVLPCLQELDMSRCGISLKSVIPLLNVSNLVDLNLSQNEFGNPVCAVVLQWFSSSSSPSSSLRRLHLCNNRMNADGVVPLLKVVRNSDNILKMLAVGGNRLGTKGREAVRDAVSARKGDLTVAFDEVDESDDDDDGDSSTSSSDDSSSSDDDEN
eukprot:g342.t1